MASHKNEKKSASVVFANNCRYFSFLLHQNSTNGSFLKVSSSVESEDMYFLYSLPWSLALWMENLPIHNLITSLIGPLENIVLQSNRELPNVDIFYIQYLKTIHCLFHQKNKVFSFWEVKLIVEGKVYPKNLFFLKVSDFVFSNKECHLFPLK